MEGNTIFISQIMGERGSYSEKKEDDQKAKYLSKEMRAYILVSCVIDVETWLHDLEGIAFSYLSDIPYGRLYDGYTTECILGMIFVTLYIVKLYCYVTYALLVI